MKREARGLSGLPENSAGQVTESRFDYPVTLASNPPSPVYLTVSAFTRRQNFTALVKDMQKTREMNQDRHWCEGWAVRGRLDYLLQCTTLLI